MSKDDHKEMRDQYRPIDPLAGGRHEQRGKNKKPPGKTQAVKSLIWQAVAWSCYVLAIPFIILGFFIGAAQVSARKIRQRF